MKLFFLLLVYFAGFATAVYLLAPEPQQNTQDISAAQSSQGTQQSRDNNGSQKAQLAGQSGFDSEKFIITFNTVLRQCGRVGKIAAVETGQFIKKKWEQRQNRAQDIPENN